jgi:hypothetical protein
VKLTTSPLHRENVLINSLSAYGDPMLKFESMRDLFGAPILIELENDLVFNPVFDFVASIIWPLS